jgi:hypothetical protein
MTLAALPVPRRPLGDRINPILVKEVRQSLRGRYFRWLFWLTLLAATLTALAVVADSTASGRAVEFGDTFFLWCFALLAAAVHGFVPFSAFLSTSAEWDENTYDLLVISNLRPRQIVLGKLQSALVQALLYYSTFGPFLVFAFLLNGVDLLSLLVILGGSAATCVALTLVGIAASSLAHLKVLRVVLMALFGAGLIAAWGATLGLAIGVISNPQDLRTPEGRAAFYAYLTVCAVVAALAAAVAIARFSHEEENRSSPMRVLGTCALLCASAWSGWAYVQFGDIEPAWIFQIAAAALCFCMWLFQMTEPEWFGRRVEAHLSRSRIPPLLWAPWLPGGGRGALLFLVHAAIALVVPQLLLVFGAPSLEDRLELLSVTAVVYAYSFLMIGLPSGIASFFAPSGRLRALLRIGVVIAVPVGILLPGLLGLFFGVRSWGNLEHPLNPFAVIDDASRRGSGSFDLAVTYVVYVSGAVLTLLLNLPRIARGIREVAVVRRRGGASASADA